MMYIHENSSEWDKAQHLAYLSKHGVDAARTLPPAIDWADLLPVMPLALDVIAAGMDEENLPSAFDVNGRVI